MPAKATEPQWEKVDDGFSRLRDPFVAAVVKIGYRNWKVVWQVRNSGWKWQPYICGLETAAIAKTHADKLLAQLTTAIAVKETQCT